MLIIHPDTTAYLSHQPELGMGFQFGRLADSNNNNVQNVLIINGTFALLKEEINNPDPWQFMLKVDNVLDNIYSVMHRIILRNRRRESMDQEAILSLYNSSLRLRYMEILHSLALDDRSYSTVSQISLNESVEDFIQFTDIPTSSFFTEGRRSTLHASPPLARRTEEKPAFFLFRWLTERLNNRFVRFSRFRSDVRILPGGGMTPGTYVTSAKDSRFAPSGLAAVGRYALPSVEPAAWRFDIVAPPGTDYLCGAVTPKFGQAGGGVEAELKRALPAGSVVRIRRLPEM